jgi:hypothetical protein
LPLGVPWQAPALQPPTLRAAITSWRKLTGWGFPVSLTVTGTRTLRAPAVTTSEVSPSLFACTKPPGETTQTSSAGRTSQKGVRSRTEPSR